MYHLYYNFRKEIYTSLAIGLGLLFLYIANTPIEVITSNTTTSIDNQPSLETTVLEKTKSINRLHIINTIILALPKESQFFYFYIDANKELSAITFEHLNGLSDQNLIDAQKSIQETGIFQ